MSRRDAAGAEGPSARAYAAHWDGVYDSASQLAREWHAASEACFEVADGFLRAAASASAAGAAALVDVGCGSSSIGVDAADEYGFRGDVVLLDVSERVIEVLRARYAEDARVRCRAADCRDCRADVADGSATCVIDKGTLDALNGDEDKRALMDEMLRMTREDGIILSVSFSAVARFVFLKRETTRLGLDWRFRVVSEGDPARGHSAIFVSVLYRSSSASLFRDVPFEDDALTRTLVERMERTGSIVDDESDDEGRVTLDFTREEEI